MGLVRVRHFENETARAVQLESWGVHLMIGTEDSGLTLGHDRRTYVFARKGSTHVKVPADALAPDGKLESIDSDEGLLDLGRPVATIGERQGFAIDFGRARVGVGVGFRSNGIVELPRDGDSVLFIRSNGGSDGPPDVYIGKEMQ